MVSVMFLRDRGDGIFLFCSLYCAYVRTLNKEFSILSRLGGTNKTLWLFSISFLISVKIKPQDIMKLKLAKEIPPFFPAQVFSETTLGFLMLVANDIVLITRYIQERKAKLLMLRMQTSCALVLAALIVTMRSPVVFRVE